MPELPWVRNDYAGTYDADLFFGAGEEGTPYVLIRTRAYNGMVPGPLIRMKACRNYRITVHNMLAEYPVGKTGTGSGQYDPTWTNLHLHGLHVSGDAPSDDVLTVNIQPGLSFTYTYRIPCDHAGGTNWYHPHKRGSTALQADGGAAGMVIIEGSVREAANTPVAYGTVPEHMLVVQEIVPYGANELAENAAAAEDQLLTVTTNTRASYWNGMTVKVEANLWQRVRILNVATTYNTVLTITPVNPVGGAPCSVVLLAKDGVFVASLPRSVPAEQSIFLSLSSRVDLAIRCPAIVSTRANAGEIVAEHHIRYRHIKHSGAAELPDTDIITTIANIVVYSSARPVAPNLPVWQPCRPAYLTKLAAPSGNPRPVAAIAVAALDGIPLTLGSTVQWDVSFSFLHPLHTHVNHMQLGPITAANQWSSLPGWHVAGDWIDTLAAPGTVPVYIRPERYTGKMVVHCHVAYHADSLGMTAAMAISGSGDGPNDIPVVTNFGTCITAPPKNQPYTVNAPFAITSFGAKMLAYKFDRGGEGIAYKNYNIGRRAILNLDRINTGIVRNDGASVEIDYSSAFGRFFVTRVRNSEWMLYTVNIQTAGVYSAALHVAAPFREDQAPITMNWSLWLDPSSGSGCPNPGSSALLVRVRDDGWKGTGPTAPAPIRAHPEAVVSRLKFNLPTGVHTLSLCFEGSAGGFELYYLEV
ncbi:hypothetical protein JKP88DRAFT_138909, partial [Tribonema minus]